MNFPSSEKTNSLPLKSYHFSFISIVVLFTLLFASSCKSRSASTGPAQKLYAIDTLVFYDTIKISQIGNQVAPIFVSLSAPVMYSNCKNIINVDLPGNPGRLTLTATNASMTLAPNQTLFSIIPTGNSCFIKGSLIANGEERVVYQSNFTTTKPPKPSLQLIVNGRDYNGLTPISSNSTISVKVKADPFFAANFADDANYEIDVIEILVQRSLGAPTKVGSFNRNGQNANNGINLSTSTMFRSDPPGTKCYVKINSVFRKTSTNQLIEVDFSESELVLGFIIK